MSLTSIPWVGLGVATILLVLGEGLKHPARNRVNHIGMLIVLASALLSICLVELAAPEGP